MTVSATQARQVFLDVPEARTLGEAVLAVLNCGDTGGGFLVVREEVSGWHFEEVSMAEAVGPSPEAGLGCRVPPEPLRTNL